MNRLLKVLLALAALVVLSLSLVSPAATIRLDEQPDEKSSATAWIGIENFGKVNDHFYRGSLPKQSDYTGLVALGVKTVISLRHRPDERVMQSAERAGMRYINLPMNVRGYPPEDLAPRFLALVNNPENWPVYVYCHGSSTTIAGYWRGVSIKLSAALSLHQDWRQRTTLQCPRRAARKRRGALPALDWSYAGLRNFSKCGG